jgi:hypothetical protein
MAALRGTTTGGNKSGDTGTASRLGSEYVTATANTWHDGRVTFEVRDDSGAICALTVGPEGATRRAVSFSRNPKTTTKSNA